jgi:hypothetical protein
MPGCGAFNNPPKIAAAHFVSTIKYYEEQLAAKGVSYNIVEYNTELAQLIDSTYQSIGKELSELNKVIHQLDKPFTKVKAIAVRERILDLYNNGSEMSELALYIDTTKQLLAAGEPTEELLDNYRLLAESFHPCPEGLWNAFVDALLKLVSAIAKCFGINNVDKDQAFRDSAQELVKEFSTDDVNDFLLMHIEDEDSQSPTYN